MWNLSFLPSMIAYICFFIQYLVKALSNVAKSKQDCCMFYTMKWTIFYIFFVFTECWFVSFVISFSPTLPLTQLPMTAILTFSSSPSLHCHSSSESVLLPFHRAWHLLGSVAVTMLKQIWIYRAATTSLKTFFLLFEHMMKDVSINALDEPIEM